MKNLKISKNTHKLLKTYCNKNLLKINEWVDKLIKNTIKNAKKTDN